MPTPQKWSPQKKPTEQRRLLLLREQGPLSIIAVTALLAPLLLAPVTSQQWHGAQTVGMEMGAVAVLVTLLSGPWSAATRKEAFRDFLSFPMLCLHLLLLWALMSAPRTADPAFAAQGTFPLAAGVLIADVVAVQARAPDRCLFITDALLGAGLLHALIGIALYGSGGMPLAVGVFHDHQLFGAFSMLMIPFSLSISLAPVGPVRRTVAQAASVVCLAALVAARCRSSWIGEAAALLMFGVLLVLAEAQKAKTRTPRRPLLLYAVGGALATIGFVAVFVGLSPDRAATFARAQTVANAFGDKDASTEWRLAAWAGTKTMIAQKPLRGWGAGSYPLLHYPFTKTGHPADVVQRQGPSIEDEAHNSYLQMAAELGVIGVVLWLTTWGALIVTGILMVRRLAPDRFRQLLLIGGVSAVAGQMVDALANPGWQFGSVTLYLWIIFGVTMSSLRQPRARRAPTSQESGAAPWPQRIILIVAGLGVGYGLVRLILQTAFALPAPHL